MQTAANAILFMTNAILFIARTAFAEFLWIADFILSCFSAVIKAAEFLFGVYTRKVKGHPFLRMAFFRRI